MTPREAFKLGFLQKCAADGLDNNETVERIRHARNMIKQSYDFLPESVRNMLGTVGKLGIGTALAAPPILGIVGGSFAADATSHDYDIDEAKKREELAEYQRAIKAMQALRAKQQQQG